jgi:poly(A) polymerase Pap1
MVFAAITCAYTPLSWSPTVDEKSQRSMNGLMAADYFLGVYKEHRKLKFFLRSIKLWALNRGIYGGITGYLGGISWQILASKIHQLYPYYSIS